MSASPDHLLDLESELDSIYNTYTNRTNNNSNDTLDSEKDQAPGPEIYRFRQSHNLPPVHISSRLSSMQADDDVVKSAPLSPSSASSFDFNINPRRYQAMTNSSLNVLISNNSMESELKDIIGESDSNVNQSVDVTTTHTYVDRTTTAPHIIPPQTPPLESEEDWNEKGAAMRTVSSGNTVKVIKRNVQDFKFGKPIGEGSYSTVVLVTDKHTTKNYACKILDKTHIIKEKKVKYVNIEKHALNRLSNRMGIISLYFTFQDKSSLYFVLDYAANGELLSLIKKHNTLNEDCVRHFGAQILDAIKYMHDNGVIHRDIKPENILLDDKLRIQITDFGTARLLEKKNDESEEYPVDVRAKSFVGTAEYVSPELLESKYCGKPGDIWAFGCIIYQMIAGKPPFKATNEYLTFQKITKLQFAFSAGFPTVIRDLIKQILVLQPSKRATIPAIQKHYFFQPVNFRDFGSIWYADPPEIGPYKMTAKSMSKVPELTKSASQQSIRKVVKKPAPRSEQRAVSEGNGNGNGVPKLVNPASAAAYVLNKKNPSESSLGSSDSQNDSEIVVTTSAATRAPSTPDYIPGTNILRPTINTRASYSRTSTSTQKKNIKAKPKPKIMEVTPLSSVEVAWGEYLRHPDERIIKIGPVQVHRESTESFERRHKGLLHNSPLGMANKLQSASRSSTSILSQVAHGSSAGLRGSPLPSAVAVNEIEDENDAIINYFEIEEIPEASAESEEAPETPTGGSSKYSTSALFKKLRLSHGDKNKDNSHANEDTASNGGSATSERHHPLDKVRTCTIVITSHGRTLIFLRTESDSSARLISEIRLNYPYIQFKELVSSGSKFQKLLPTSGIFAIESLETSFVFETEKFEVNQWTEALARSKINQSERSKASSESSSRSVSSSQISASPKLQESPSFGPSTHRRTASSGVPITEEKTRIQDRGAGSAPSTPVTRPTPEPKHSHLMAAKMKSKPSVRRKPPPPLTTSNGLDMSTGLAPDQNGNGNGLQAAVLAVSNNPTSPPTTSSSVRRSSFTKEDRSKYRAPVPGTRNSSSPSAGITSKNSKLLARSQRTK